MLKVLEKTTWDKIKIGEVFALKGCWQIGYKIDDNRLMCLATTAGRLDERNGEILTMLSGKNYIGYYSVKEGMTIMGENGNLYKLPKYNQDLWRTI